MGAKYGREIKALLRKNGFRYLRPGKGDHEIWHNSETNTTVIVDNNTRNRHTANGILKSANIQHKF